MSFTVIFPTAKGTRDRPFCENDKFEFLDGGVLAVRKAESDKTVYYAPGRWLEVSATNHAPRSTKPSSTAHFG
jgi:hypothetical protein